MKRKIAWDSYVFDEIELVYEKAENDSGIAELLERLEDKALSEAQAACIPGGLLATQRGNSISPERFRQLDSESKEHVINALARMGLAALETDIENATIPVTFSPSINLTIGCTVFDLLNRLEKLDGALNILNPKWSLELRVPLGARKGLFQWEMLIMQLYPWLSVREVPLAVTAVPAGTEAPAERTKESPTKPSPEKKPEPQKKNEPEKKPEPQKKNEPEKKPEPQKKNEPEKKSFWKKLFG